jgi:hypothetical protein
LSFQPLTAGVVVVGTAFFMLQDGKEEAKDAKS